MDRKKLALLVGALVIAIGTALAARSMFAGAAAPVAAAAPMMQPQKGPKVLVAQRALPVGTIITADAMSFQQWPKEMVDNAYFLQGDVEMDKLLGTVVRHPIMAGEPVTRGALVSPGDRGFLAAALAPGMRAVTIPVSDKTAVAGFIFPGDRVDLVLTQTVEGGGDGGALRASETFLANLRVLATDQSTASEVVDGKTVVREFSTVTLEVTPKIAEKVAVAQTIGTISLSLRSIADNAGDLERAIVSGTVDLPAGASRAEEEKIIRTAMNRPQDRTGSYVTGADVSRYQRSSLPPPQSSSSPAPSGAPAAPGNPAATVPLGPSVKISRGNAVETVTVKK